MSNVITYTSDETATVVDYVSAIVTEARAREALRLAAAEDEERMRAERKAARAAQMLEIARASLPEPLRPFVEVKNSAWDNWRAVITLPGCAPFGIDIHGETLSNWYYPATCDDSVEYKPSLCISSSMTDSTLESEIARAYEAEAKYTAALAIWTLTQAEREHVDAMSTRESTLRHEEEPEPVGYSGQPAKLSKLTDKQILALAEECIALADTSINPELERDNWRAVYYLNRANALSRYIMANNSGYLASIADN
jgi:hypothetical protein